MTKPFDGISEKEKQKLLKEFESITMNFNKNQNILTNLNLSNLVCIIENGSVNIVKIDYEGNKIIVESLETGSMFGTRFSILNNNEYEIIAKENTDLIIIDYDIIVNSQNKKSNYYHQFIVNMLSITTTKISDQNEHINILSKKTIREKLLEYFAIQSSKNFSKTLKLPFSYTELSDYLSIDRSAMMRELKHLKEDKIIETNGRNIKLLY